jgi:NADH-quinone oxidoreductase subunit E
MAKPSFQTPSDKALTEGRTLDREPVGFEDLAEVEVPAGLRREIQAAMKKYPQKRSASIPALWAVQRKYGWCTPQGIRQAAAVMGVTPAYLESVASFYDLFHLEPVGKHEVLVCTNISCWLRGGDEILAAFKEAAAGTIRSTPNEPSAAGPGREAEEPAVHVRGFECLGACDLAPMASIDERYYGPLEPSDAPEAVSELAKGKKGKVLRDKRLEDREAAGGFDTPADERTSRHPLNKPKPKKRVKKA